MRLPIIFTLFMSILFAQSVPVFAKNEGVSLHIDLLDWEEVNEILPKYSKFTVLDVKTGKRFEVQRRAGSSHADVQPLTAKDTEIMKEIYGGEWSWKRRAIIVIHGDQWIAASMNGMPHGAGTLDNNFRGHFCIHFNGSKTHRKNAMDESHKLMILKAAGELDAYLANADPFTVISSFIAGMKQQDADITSLISFQTIDWKNIFRSVENIKIRQVHDVSVENKTVLEVPVEIEWIDDRSERRIYQGDVHLIRIAPTDVWKIDSVRFFKESGMIQK
ncbi:hypothetical protein [Bacillus sp. FJAT-50079]|uniref:hypothetical protein n=1 Tax=Bacillus sp. FJAT-50079 TaxID=2833577 RepID=UPI001BC8E5C9|nr:hypothetical protein [Bacillus sp. FJAT-50079]MBS4208369.1 hypothetical protein [Bacillus sp. FJAT-50079]